MRKYFVKFLIAFLIACFGIASVVGNVQAALTFHSGFEMGDFGEWAIVTGSPTVVTNIKNTGAYAMRSNTSAGTAYVLAGGASSTDTRRISFYLYIATAPDGETEIFKTYVSPDPIAIRLTSDRYLKLFMGLTEKDVGSTQLSTGQWYRISLSHDLASEDAKIYLDGIEECSSVAMGSFTTGSNRIGVLTSVSADLYFDDFASDTTESLEDIGDIRVELSQPNAVGNYSQFDNPVPSATNYENIDNNPQDANVDDDYNEIEATGTYRDSYNIENSSTVGLGGSDTVEAVSTWARLKRNGGGGTDHMVLVRDNGSDYLTADFPLNTVWLWCNKYDAVMPNGGGAWTQARFDDFEVGVYRSGAQDQHVSNMFVMVAYIVVSDGADISNVPSSKSFGVISASSINWSSSSEPSWPLVDADAFFTVTNNSSGAVSIAYRATNFTGGDGWNLTTGNPGSGTVRMSVFIEGDGSGDGDALTTGDQTLIPSLGASSDTDWELKLETGTFTDGTGKTSTITLTATLL